MSAAFRQHVEVPHVRSEIENKAIAAALAGTVATVVVVTALGALARSPGKNAVQPINATSHWVHGPRAGRKRHADLRHTGTGFLTNHLASIFWALPLQFLVSRKSPASDVAAKAAVISGLAALVDYRLMPKRLTPGWEHALGKRGVAAGFAALAVGLFAGTLIAQRARGFGDRTSLMSGDTLRGR